MATCTIVQPPTVSGVEGEQTIRGIVLRMICDVLCPQKAKVSECWTTWRLYLLVNRSKKKKKIICLVFYIVGTWHCSYVCDLTAQLSQDSNSYKFWVLTTFLEAYVSILSHTNLDLESLNHPSGINLRTYARFMRFRPQSPWMTQQNWRMSSKKPPGDDPPVYICTAQTDVWIIHPQRRTPYSCVWVMSAVRAPSSVLESAAKQFQASACRRSVARRRETGTLCIMDSAERQQ